METWKLIQRILDYIEDNLDDEIEINNLSGMAYLSTFYFQRLFTRLVGKPVMEYVKLRRLAKAAELIIHEKCKIIDVGISVGFKNPETFSRVFKSYYGLQPGTYRKDPRPLTHFIKPDLSMQYRLIEENFPLVAEDIVLEVSRRDMAKPRFFSGLEMEVPFPNNPGIDYLAELWNDFHRIKNSISNLKQGGNEIGVGSPCVQEGYLKYFVGTEVTRNDISSDMSGWTIPEGSYVICSFEAESFQLLITNALDKAVNYMYQVWLPNNKILTEPFLVELYFETYHDADYMEVWFKVVGKDNLNVE